MNRSKTRAVLYNILANRIGWNDRQKKKKKSSIKASIEVVSETSNVKILKSDVKVLESNVVKFGQALVKQVQSEHCVEIMRTYFELTINLLLPLSASLDSFKLKYFRSINCQWELLDPELPTSSSLSLAVYRLKLSTHWHIPGSSTILSSFQSALHLSILTQLYYELF